MKCLINDVRVPHTHKNISISDNTIGIRTEAGDHLHFLNGMSLRLNTICISVKIRI